MLGMRERKEGSEVLREGRAAAAERVGRSQRGWGRGPNGTEGGKDRREPRPKGQRRGIGSANEREPAGSPRVEAHALRANAAQLVAQHSVPPVADTTLRYTLQYLLPPVHTPSTW